MNARRSLIALHQAIERTSFIQRTYAAKLARLGFSQGPHGTIAVIQGIADREMMRFAPFPGIFNGAPPQTH